jgi:hypothetical protein
MASFDLDTFLKIQGAGATGAIGALGMSFGLPSCMLELGKEAFELLPSDMLSSLKGQVSGAKDKAEEKQAGAKAAQEVEDGITAEPTEDGSFVYISDSSYIDQDRDEVQEKKNFIGIIQAIGSFAGDAYSVGTQLYNEYNAALDCYDKFTTILKFKGGNSADELTVLSDSEFQTYQDEQYASLAQTIQQTSSFINKCDNSINSINAVLLERQQDPSLEPCFSDSEEFDIFFSGTSVKRCAPDDPGVVEDEEDIFRLTYGPPVTTAGQYVLTNDGLYYDSKSGGLDPVFLAISGIVPVGDKWKYDYDPNLGGKGDAISIKALNLFQDNIFDPEKIDDSLGLQMYYDEDHFLSVVKQQRDKFVYDLSSDLQSYITEYGEDSSIVKNQRQLIISEIANHNSKINRRKKQIEVSIKGPQIYGGESSPLYAPGEVPINDFSYLEDYNLEVDLEKQKALMLDHAELEGIILPLDPKFVKAPSKSPSITYDHLNVPTIGKGSIIYTPSATQSATVLSLTDQIVSDKLFGIYNFLETDLVLPSSIDFKTTNCATENQYNNVQTVAASKKSIFASGLSIPYLEGIVKNKYPATSMASALGSYVRLPSTPEYRDLTYSPSGFTMECWVHVPNIMDGEIGWLSSTTSSLTKVLLGNENVGAKEGASSLNSLGDLRDLDYLPYQNGEQFVKGMLCGFTRDRRITQDNVEFSNNNALNSPTSSLSFFIAPTISRDLSSASFINSDDCQDIPTFHKMKVDLSASDFGNVSSQFVLVDVTCDPVSDTIKMFADGNLVATSSISTVFGVPPTIPPSLPGFKKDNSFEYTPTTVDGPNTLKQGPKLDPFYTPWIVGGGYTDGMYQYGNFMGGDRGGIVSGLRGHIGSLKFYSKALDTSEVLQNFKAQKGFFKNIVT